MQQAWNRYAFIRFALFMGLGIIAAVYLPQYQAFIFFTFFILASTYLILQFKRRVKFKGLLATVFGLAAFAICFSFGYLNTYQQAQKYEKEHIFNLSQGDTQAFKARLVNAGRETEKTYGFKVEVMALKTEEQWVNSSGKAILYLQKDSLSKNLKYGDIILVKGGLGELSEPKNPGEFNYKQFLGYDQIYHQQYVPQHNFKLLERDQGNVIIASSIHTSQFLAAQLDKYIEDPRSLAISKALTLGIKDELDNDLRNAYAAAGAMHVLAVSGLHVGIIFLIVAAVFKKWRKQRNGRIAFTVVSLFILWFYAFVTGLSPSVLRAATMFSFIIIAQAMKRRTNIYNTVAASSFVLLCINPFLLFSVGFQLSYLAVVGIVFFQPKIYRILQFKHPFFDKIWAITAVSIAAQLATAPLGILYFHQFPTYFFLSNLVVIPAAFIILNGTLLLLVASAIPVLANVVGLAIDYFIQFVNYLVFGLDVFPHSLIDGIYITTPEAWFIYIIIGCFALLITEKKLGYLKTACALTLLFSISIIVRQYENFENKKFTVYSTGKSESMALKVGFQQFLNISEDLYEDQNKLKFHIYPSVLQSGIIDFESAKPEHQSLPFENELAFEIVVWQSKRIVNWNNELQPNLSMKSPIPIDYLILSKNAVRNPNQIFKIFKPKLIILASNNSYYNIQNLKVYFEAENIDFYDVNEEGAFELNL